MCNNEQPSGKKRVLKAKTEGLWYFLAVLSASQTICMTVGSPMGHRFPLFTTGIVILNWVKTPWGTCVESALRCAQWTAIIFAWGSAPVLSSDYVSAPCSSRLRKKYICVSDFDWPRITPGISNDLMWSSSLSDSISKGHSEMEISNASVMKKIKWNERNINWNASGNPSPLTCLQRSY